ncbi:MAG: glutaredoxin [Myxococcota bacterium]
MPAATPTPDQNRELVLYQADYCPFCRRVTQALSAFGEQVQVEIRDTMQPEFRQELRERTGRTQVPCLMIDGVPLFESLDIIAWLDSYVERKGA